VRRLACTATVTGRGISQVDTCEGWGLFVAKNGDLSGHQRGLQLAIGGDLAGSRDHCNNSVSRSVLAKPIEEDPNDENIP
jgi:hypothetical protein